MSKIYDRAYFDHWYRDPSRQLEIEQHLKRKVNLALAQAEYYLGYPPRTVLDVGCGEGLWREALLAIDPKIRYLGLDSSEYAIERYGRERNLHWVSFGDLAELRFEEPVDLLICADVMHYVPTRELELGLSGFAELCDGVAWLEAYCTEDAVEGDHDGYIERDADWYRQRFADAGFRACGSHCYLAPERHEEAMALEFQSTKFQTRDPG